MGSRVSVQPIDLGWVLVPPPRVPQLRQEAPANLAASTAASPVDEDDRCRRSLSGVAWVVVEECHSPGPSTMKQNIEEATDSSPPLRLRHHPERRSTGVLSVASSSSVPTSTAEFDSTVAAGERLGSSPVVERHNGISNCAAAVDGGELPVAAVTTTHVLSLSRKCLSRRLASRPLSTTDVREILDLVSRRTDFCSARDSSAAPLQEQEQAQHRSSKDSRRHRLDEAVAVLDLGGHGTFLPTDALTVFLSSHVIKRLSPAQWVKWQRRRAAHYGSSGGQRTRAALQTSRFPCASVGATLVVLVLSGTTLRCGSAAVVAQHMVAPLDSSSSRAHHHQQPYQQHSRSSNGSSKQTSKAYLAAPHLRELRLDRCSLDDDACAHIADALLSRFEFWTSTRRVCGAESVLRFHLYLRDNFITDEGAAGPLQRLLRYGCRATQDVILASCTASTGAAALPSGRHRDVQPPPAAVLQRLAVDGNPLGDDGFIALLDGLASRLRPSRLGGSHRLGPTDPEGDAAGRKASAAADVESNNNSIRPAEGVNAESDYVAFRDDDEDKENRTAAVEGAPSTIFGGGARHSTMTGNGLPEAALRNASAARSNSPQRVNAREVHFAEDASGGNTHDGRGGHGEVSDALSQYDKPVCFEHRHGAWVLRSSSPLASDNDATGWPPDKTNHSDGGEDDDRLSVTCGDCRLTRVGLQGLLDVLSRMHDERVLHALAVEETLTLHRQQVQHLLDTPPSSARAAPSRLDEDAETLLDLLRSAASPTAPSSLAYQVRSLRFHALRSLVLRDTQLGDRGIELLCNAMTSMSAAARAVDQALAATCEAGWELLESSFPHDLHRSTSEVVASQKKKKTGCESAPCVGRDRTRTQHVVEPGDVESTANASWTRTAGFLDCLAFLEELDITATQTTAHGAQTLVQALFGVVSVCETLESALVAAVDHGVACDAGGGELGSRETPSSRPIVFCCSECTLPLLRVLRMGDNPIGNAAALVLQEFTAHACRAVTKSAERWWWCRDAACEPQHVPLSTDPYALEGDRRNAPAREGTGHPHRQHRSHRRRLDREFVLSLENCGMEDGDVQDWAVGMVSDEVYLASMRSGIRALVFMTTHVEESSVPSQQQMLLRVDLCRNRINEGAFTAARNVLHFCFNKSNAEDCPSPAPLAALSEAKDESAQGASALPYVSMRWVDCIVNQNFIADPPPTSTPTRLVGPIGTESLLGLSWFALSGAPAEWDLQALRHDRPHQGSPLRAHRMRASVAAPASSTKRLSQPRWSTCGQHEVLNPNLHDSVRSGGLPPASFAGGLRKRREDLAVDRNAALTPLLSRHPPLCCNRTAGSSGAFCAALQEGTPENAVVARMCATSSIADATVDALLAHSDRLLLLSAARRKELDIDSS